MRMIQISEVSTKDGSLLQRPPTIDSKLLAMTDAVFTLEPPQALIKTQLS
jgi:hypothetical protein